MEYIPPLLTEFLGYLNLCWSCRNSIAGYVGEGINTEGWKLCWQRDTDDALKWAMLDWLRNSYWLEAFHIALEGYSNREEAFFGALDHDERLRQFWTDHGNNDIREKIRVRYANVA